jgi:predicted MPP superfamily phosphohydrolase
MRILYYIITFGLVCFSWALIEGQLFRVKRIKVTSKKIKEQVKIVFISDIHYGNYYYKSRLERIIRTINKLEPDIILIGGDYLDFGKDSKLNKPALQELFKEMSALKARFGVFTVLGNHDYYLEKDMEFMMNEIKKSNIRLIMNSTFEVKVNSDKLILHGVVDLQEGDIDISKLHFQKEFLNIMIAHNPDFYEEFNVKFDLAFSGHLHGGQVNFFGIYAPQTESKYGQKYIKEINRKGEAMIITTKGLGCSSLPIRFFAMPEIVLCEVEHKNGAQSL